MGIQMVDGSLKVNCAQCGLNSTHSTKFHDAYFQNPSSFKLSADHPYVRECAKLKNTPPPTALLCAPADNKQGSGSAGNLISIDRAQLEKKIMAFEHESTNPSASDVSEAIWALLLN
jgi:hypothetical protein